MEGFTVITSRQELAIRCAYLDLQHVLELMNEPQNIDWDALMQTAEDMRREFPGILQDLIEEEEAAADASTGYQSH